MPFDPSVLDAPGTVLLDAARPADGRARSLLFARPVEVLAAHDAAGVLPALRAAEAALDAGRYVAGMVAYEAGYALVDGMEEAAPPAAGPLVWLGVYDAPVPLSPDDLAALLPAPRAPDVRDGAFAYDRPAYAQAIHAVRDAIREGEVYQINLTAPYRFRTRQAPPALYAALRARQPVAYAAYLHLGDVHVLSLSPELFFRRDGDRLTTRPMKGTVRRGRTGEEDERLRRWLAQDAKSRAENLMIVDLLRNDASRVCEAGSVRVPQLFSVETYDTVHQMTSTVEGRVRPGVGLSDLFAALFPCGSVTGAPKRRAMRHIRRLETEARGVYCGAVGYAAPGGEAVFSVAIRTITLRGRDGVVGLGSGVVWDSDADAEYDECLLKARFLTACPSPMEYDGRPVLIETMRWEGGVALLDLHADRLRSSAAYLGYPFDGAAFRAVVDDAGRGLAEGSHRVRVTLDAGGELRVTTQRLGAEGASPLRLTVAAEPTDASDRWYYHKTTHRRVYEDAFAAAQADGFDEVLFRNGDGQVTECARGNLFVRRGGELLTPPVSAGLLPGVYRRHLLETGAVREASLTLDDVLGAEAVFVANAVRGLRPVGAVVVPAPV